MAEQMFTPSGLAIPPQAAQAGGGSWSYDAGSKSWSSQPAAAPGTAPAGGANASGMPLDLNSILSQFTSMNQTAGAQNPFAAVIAQLNAAKAARQQQIEGQFTGAKDEAAEQGKFRTAGAESMAARFTGPSFSSFAQGLVQKEIMASDKRMKDLESAKAQALNDLDANYLEKIGTMQMQEMERQDQLRQAAVGNALQYMNMQLNQKNFDTQNDPANLRYKALLDKYPTAGINMGDTPEQVAAKLQNIPMTPMEKAQLQNELRLAKGGNGGGGTGTQPGAFYEEATVISGKLKDGTMTWGNAWNYLKARYPSMSNEQIDGALGKYPAAPTAAAPTSTRTTSTRTPAPKQPGYMEQIQANSQQEGYTNWLDSLSSMFK